MQAGSRAMQNLLLPLAGWLAAATAALLAGPPLLHAVQPALTAHFQAAGQPAAVASLGCCRGPAKPPLAALQLPAAHQRACCELQAHGALLLPAVPLSVWPQPQPLAVCLQQLPLQLRPAGFPQPAAFPELQSAPTARPPSRRSRLPLAAARRPRCLAAAKQCTCPQPPLPGLAATCAAEEWHYEVSHSSEDDAALCKASASAQACASYCSPVWQHGERSLLQAPLQGHYRRRAAALRADCVQQRLWLYARGSRFCWAAAAAAIAAIASAPAGCRGTAAAETAGRHACLNNH